MRRVRAWALVGAAMAAHAAPLQADVLRGVVRDSLDRPVFDADFDVYTTDGMLLEADDNSDADGSYEILLPPGRYDVVCEPVPASGLAPFVRRGVEVAGETRLDWVLPTGFRVLGRVFGPAGPVAGVDLDFDDAATGERQPATGDITSLFGTFAAIAPAGTYRVSFFPPEASGLAPAQLPWVEIPTTDTLRVDLVPAVHLSGTATVRGGGTAAGARLTLLVDPGGERVPILGNRTDATGRYRIAAPPGRYRLRIAPPRGNGVVPLETPVIDLTVDRDESFELATGPTLSGTVRARDGRPLVNADWDVFDAVSGASIFAGEDDTDEAGRFALSLPAGTYRLMLTPPHGSGLDTLTFDSLELFTDRALNVDYSRLAGAPRSALAIAPAANPSRLGGGVLVALPEAGEVRVELFDAAGRRVNVLAAGWRPAGAHALAWDGRNAAGARVGAGVFFLRVRQGPHFAVARWVVLP